MDFLKVEKTYQKGILHCEKGLRNLNRDNSTIQQLNN